MPVITKQPNPDDPENPTTTLIGGTEPQPRRPIISAMLHGALRVCPSCGVGRAFQSYLKVVPCCSHCGAELGEIRADDGPPYFTIILVGHIVVPLALFLEQAYHPPLWFHMALWAPVALLLALATLPLVKGAIVGLMWALRIRGDETFDGGPHPDKGAGD